MILKRNYNIHEWVMEISAVMGRISYAQSELGDLVFVNLTGSGNETEVLESCSIDVFIHR